MTATAITKHEPSHLAAVETFRFTADQRKLILDTCCGGASASEAMVLLGIAEMRGLNPLTQECYFVQRWDSQKGRMVWAVQVSIDAMRIKAEESGLYAGQDEPEYEYETGSKVPTLARVKVYRRDWDRPCVGVARYSEYVQKKKDGTPTKFWVDMPHNQLAKCAESAALRKAFPARLAKLYTPEEMAQADNGRNEPEMRGEVVEAPPQRPASTPPPANAPPSQMHNVLRAQLVGAKTLAELKEAWGGVLRAAKAAKVTLTERAALQALKDERKGAMEAPIDTAAALEEAMGDNPAPEWMGGPADKDPHEKCVYCGEPVGAGGVQFESSDGEVVQKHPGCTAFGRGEMAP